MYSHIGVLRSRLNGGSGSAKSHGFQKKQLGKTGNIRYFNGGVSRHLKENSEENVLTSAMIAKHKANTKQVHGFNSAKTSLSGTLIKKSRKKGVVTFSSSNGRSFIKVCIH